MDEDFEYDTGRVIPRDSAGWREFEFNRMKKIKDFFTNGNIDLENDAFFRVPWQDQTKLQNEHPALKEAWNHYMVLLSMTYEEQNGTRL
jgi:hypothetical protein